jgi:hypothetical protein
VASAAFSKNSIFGFFGEGEDTGAGVFGRSFGLQPKKRATANKGRKKTFDAVQLQLTRKSGNRFN